MAATNVLTAAPRRTRHARGWLAVVGTLAAACGGAWWMTQGGATAPDQGPAPVAAATLSAAVLPAALPQVAQTAEIATGATAPAGCAAQAMRIEGPGLQSSAIEACLKATRTLQSGDLRTYALEADGASRWRLQLITGAGALIEARLLSAEGVEYRCRVGRGAHRCAGISIGERDANGGRTLTLAQAPLARGAAGEGTPGETLRVTAQLQVLADQQDPALACTGASVNIVRGNGQRLSFCPSAGGGVALVDHGRRLYTLRNLEGDNLVIGVDAAGRVDQVELGELHCRGLDCSGISTAASTSRIAGEDSEPGRSFSFSGTPLWNGRDRAAAATLDGSVAMPEL